MSQPHQFTRKPIHLRGALLALLTAALWGGNPVAVSYSVDVLPPVAVAAVRFVMGTAFMWFWCRIEGTSLRMLPGQWIPALVAGILMFLQIASFNWGVLHSNSSHSSMLINTAIFWVVGFEHFITGADRMNRRKLAGLLAAAMGVVAVLGVSPPASTAARDTVTLAGDLVLLGSAVLLATKLVYVQRVVRVIEPGKLIFWHNVVGLVGFTVFSALFEKPELGIITWPAILGIIYQGVFVAGLCFAIQAVLLRHHSASQVSVFGFATPLFGVALGAVFRGDPLSSTLLIAAVAVAVGIVLVHLEPRAPAGPAGDVAP